jgi:putative SOS response-associated peptidase YedK
MCGRFVGYRGKEELMDLFPIDQCDAEVSASYNIAPSQEILAIVKQDGRNHLQRFHWGLVPFWAKDISIGARMINARAESVDSKPSFRTAFKKRRCLILSDGFYEWQGEKGHKQPYFLTIPEEKPFAFAGIWETWDNRGQQSEGYRSCAIITTAASDAMRPIHHRMPVILKPEIYGPWLDPDFQDVDELKDIITDRIITELIARPVSKQVNTATNNQPTNIRPLKQMELKI